MSLDVPSSTAAFSPPPVVLFEPAGRRGIATSTPFEDGPPPPPPPRRRIVPQEGAFQSRATAIETETLDPVTEYIVKTAVDLWKKEQQTRAQIQDRLRELHVDALRNAEPFSDSSLADLRSFLDSLPLIERPSIFLLDDVKIGILRLGCTGTRLGLLLAQSSRFKRLRGRLPIVWAFEAKDSDSGHRPHALLFARVVAVIRVRVVAAAPAPGIGSRRLRRCRIGGARQNSICENQRED
jgi:hypothetical protein